jgi:hypothetical protein
LVINRLIVLSVYAARSSARISSADCRISFRKDSASNGLNRREVGKVAGFALGKGCKAVASGFSERILNIPIIGSELRKYVIG